MKNRLKLFFLFVAIAAGAVTGCSSTEEKEEPSGNTDEVVDKCGNGIIDNNDGETCDDGNKTDGDGCSSKCQIETTHRCWYDYQINKSVCALKGCGDAFLDTANGEQCDFGNKTVVGCDNCRVVNGYTCDSLTCRKESGSTPNDPDPETCGDGKKTAREQCDDGNKTAGDGCSDKCKVELGYSCPTFGQACVKVSYCGDGVLDNDPSFTKIEQCDLGKEQNLGTYDGCRTNCTLGPHCGDGVVQTYAGEECDDGGKTSGDGCSDNCRLEEKDSGRWICRPGHQCEENLCGNGVVDKGEMCDDGNREDGDGCHSTCKRIETGYECSYDSTQSKSVCSPKKCGDGVLIAPELCDDGNTRSGDGCNSFCEVEDGYHCKTPGVACEHTICGNGTLEGDEECDDGGKATGDGCSDKCKIELGHKCKQNASGVSECGETLCGDGIIEGAEQCDDGNADDTNNLGEKDGCSSMCQIQDGYKCWFDAALGKSQCSKITCGDGKKEGNELCDDGNVLDGDGCDHNCVPETTFHECSKIDGKCKPICGDGVFIEGEEECDDGNLQNGDGCSDTCKVEKGYTCTGNTRELPPFIKLPIVYRDFRSYKEYTDQNMSAHGRDFQNQKSCQFIKGLVKDELGADGTPELTDKGKKCFGPGNPATPVESFNEWYHTISGVNDEVRGFLTLRQDGGPKSNTYVYNSNENTPKGFWPLDGLGFGNYPYYRSGEHNFHFTSVFKTYFKYEGTGDGPTLSFSGDDDLWVFINGKLAIDLGGLHSREEDAVTLTPSPKVLPKSGQSTTWNQKFNLYAGGIYQIAVFHAERHTHESNYWITLAGFINTGETTCSTKCGDGIVAGSEKCDIGDKNGDENFGCDNNCMPYPGWNCTNNPGDPSVCVKTTCGNGSREYPEQCDLGTTENAKGVHCTSDCKFPGCGNGTVDVGYEECDDGDDTDPNDGCHECHLPVCGNGRVEASEECDDGNNDTSDYCVNCKVAFCGDGFVGAFEVCDDGVNNNGYGSCTTFCDGEGPHCGDAILDTNNGEECDYGTSGNTGAYGGCTSDCKLANYCGDGKYYSAEEACDDGNNDNNDGCSRECQVEPGWGCQNTEGQKSTCDRNVG